MKETDSGRNTIKGVDLYQGRPPGRKKREPTKTVKTSLPMEVVEWLDSMGGARLFLTLSYALYLKGKEQIRK